MPIFGYSMSSEEHRPLDLVRHAVRAEGAGFPTAWISDHFHPWVDRQGQSPFVWSVLGGIAAGTDRLRVGTGVTCPTIRIHPAVIAQAVATTTAMLPGGRFFFGVGTGEALNEHILGDRWPPADIRLAMLEEAIEVMRLLWQGGSRSHHGPHYTVENARLYTLPDEAPPIFISGFGPKSIAVAARIGDGYVNTEPSADMVQSYKDQGGTGPTLAGMKGCWATDESAARKLAFEMWPNAGVPGELSQDLPTPAHFEQASSLVMEADVADSIPCGPDPEQWMSSLQEYADAGYDEIYVHQIGPDQDGFFNFWQAEIKPRLAKAGLDEPA